MNKPSPQLPQLARIPGLFLNRELSQIAFNRRVLAQAEDPNVPLLERLRYLCIVSSNLDEFFEVRVASLLAPNQLDISKSLPSSVAHALREADAECHQMVEQQYKVLNDDILPALAAHGIHLLRNEDRTEEQRAWVKSYFEEQVKPLLTPVVLDPSHPFPQVINKSLNFIVELANPNSGSTEASNQIAVVRAPRVLPRVIRLPASLGGGPHVYCLLSSILHAHLGDIFGEREVVAYSQFRVTRNSDLWVDEDEVKNLREALQTELLTRHFGFAVRVEVANCCPPHLAQYLTRQFGIEPSRLYAVDGPVNLARLLEIVNSIEAPHLRFPPFVGGTPDRLTGSGIFSMLRSKDVLLHHPFHTFQPVLEFIRSAARDPNVVAIKQTIYRTGVNSDLMESLILAAQSGKEVTVVLELMARFDEQANIRWAEQLERSGAQVVYGMVGTKIHGKMALVIRREADKLRYYAHLGTGNYHPTTTKFYTDFGLLTANSEIGREVNEVFLYLTSLTMPKALRHLWVAPFSMSSKIIAAIQNEAAIARAGRPAHIIAKMNALTDESVIRALYDASGAGVKIDLIVRGACALRPGVDGLSENIRVRSIIGRFLEHTRIYYFRNDDCHDIYLGSADWMSRNLVRRVEVGFPVLDKRLKRQVLMEGLRPYLKDTANAWQLDQHGQYQRVRPRSGRAAFSAQIYLADKLGTLDNGNG